MRFKDYINEKVISRKKRDNIWETVTDDILFIVSADPREFVKNPDAANIYRMIIGRKGGQGLLRYGHAFPHNMGVVQAKFSKPIKLFHGGATPYEVIDVSYIVEVNGIRFDYGRDAFKYIRDKLRPKWNIIVDYFSGKLNRENLPGYVKAFVDVYIAMGLQRYSPGDSEYRSHEARLKKLDINKVAQFYQDNIKRFPPPPSKVYRGIYASSWKGYKDIGEIEKLAKKLGIKFKTVKLGDTVTYKHPWNRYPISTSTSVVIALDFARYPYIMKQPDKLQKYLGLVYQFNISPADIVFDTRAIITDHPAQGEICIRSDKTYSAKLVRVGKILNGKIIS